MRSWSAILIAIIATQFHGAWSVRSFADEPLLPPGDTSPLLRLETSGPRNYVSGLAFSPDGRQLYATGWDKAVQVWNLREDRQYVYSSGATLRIPTGAGPFGRQNALALSANGNWLAVAGQGHSRQVPGEKNTGWVLPAGNLSQMAQLDTGTIYVFNTVTRTTALLRGHRGPVQALTFVENSRANPPELVSVAQEQADESDDPVFRLRFWDVGQSKEVASLSKVPGGEGANWQPLPNLNGFRPGLAAWSTGASPNQARVAIAWGDDRFRIWDVKTGQVASSPSNPNLITVLAVPPRTDQLISGAHAAIGLWSIPAGVNGQLGAITLQQFQLAQIDSVNGKAQNLPSAVGLIPARAGRPAYAVFVITKYLASGAGEYRLLMASTNSPIQTVREIALPWQVEIRQPSLAVSRDGQRLALAGNERNEIELYQVDDLLSGKTAPLQVLASVGTSFKDALFVRSADGWGLELAGTARDSSGRFPANALVFDVNQRQVEEMTDRWRPAIAAPDGWSINSSTGSDISIRRPAGNLLELKLIDQHEPTASAFCGPSVHCPVPLVAIASQRRGQPLLQLFNGETGQPLRWCVGHTERIRSVTFSEDGRMLVSVSDDRTVSVWTTTDLAERTLGKHGRLPGVTVGKSGAKLVVISAPPDSSLQKGDQIISGLRDQKAISFESPREFYQHVLKTLPGQPIELSIRRSEVVQTVASVAGQAIDESKPLFTLFVAPGDRNQPWEWIGWNPSGNFDARGDRIDQSLGWHFNTGDPARPAKFAAIGEYRDAFYRRDLLRTLIDTQKLPAVAVIMDDPKVSIWLRNLDGTSLLADYEDVPQIKDREVELVADVTGVPHTRVLGLDAVLDDSIPLVLRRDGQSGEWTADLSSLEWRRGMHRIDVKLKTAVRDVAAAQNLHFYPAPPVIQWIPDPAWKTEVATEQIVVDAMVIPASDPIRVQLLLQRSGADDATIVRSWDVKDALTIRENVAIPPGENRLEIVCWNSTAPEEVRNLETARAVAFVRRSTPPMAPRITLQTVSGLLADGQMKPVESEGDLYRTVTSQIRLQGKISAQGPIAQAKIVWKDAQRDLQGFRENEVQEFDIDETVTLQPGRQTVVIQSTVAGEQDEKRLAIVYEPGLPRLTSMAAEVAGLRDAPSLKDEHSLVCFATNQKPLATIIAILESPFDAPYRAQLRVNDIVIDRDLVAIDRTRDDQHRLKAEVPLRGGRNQLTLRLENDWTRQPVTRTIEIDYRRVPEFLEVIGAATLVDQPLELTCRIRSPLPIRSTKIVIDDTDEVTGVISEVRDAADEYLLVVEKVGLSAGPHQIRVTAANDEGTSLEAAIHRVTVDRPVSRPPVLEVINPVASDSVSVVSAQRLEIQFAVRSSLPATIQLRNRGVRIVEESIPAESVPIDGTIGLHTLDLFEGVNELELTARNSGGFGEKRSFKVSYVPPAATVEIVSLDEQRPQIRNDGQARFDRKASKSRVPLRGRVLLRNRDDQGATLRARIWVNNFKLPTIDVARDPNDAAMGYFSSEITLTRPFKNEVKVEVYSEERRVASEMGCTNTLTIDCEKPERRQDLYLVLMGTTDETGLRESALKALQARVKNKSDTSQEIWESDAFSQIHLFQALNVHPATAQHRLSSVMQTMRKNLSSLSKSGSNAIVMVWFQGRIQVKEDDFSFFTSTRQTSDDKALTGKILESQLAKSYGAHLLFLDLTLNSANLTASEIWPKAPQLGIIVSNWKGQGQQPDETRLITALEQTMPQIRVVRELADRIDQRYEAARKKFPEQIEAVDRLQELRDLRFGILD